MIMSELSVFVLVKSKMSHSWKIAKLIELGVYLVLQGVLVHVKPDSVLIQFRIVNL